METNQRSCVDNKFPENVTKTDYEQRAKRKYDTGMNDEKTLNAFKHSNDEKREKKRGIRDLKLIS